MKRKHFFWLSCCLCLVLTACQQTHLKEISKKSDGIKEAMQSFIDEKQLAGAVTLVMKDGEVVHHQAVGWAHIENQKPMQLNSIFSIASMTKVVTGTAIMMLEEQGKLSIDDKASKFIPEFKKLRLEDGSKPNREITIKDLLTHTSGLKNKKMKPKNLTEACQLLLDQAMIGQVGEQWVYGPGLTFCGRIIELLSGQSYEDFLKEHIFRPLNMKDTTFQPNQEMIDRHAYVYMPSKNGKEILPAPDSIQNIPVDGQKLFPNPSGGLKSTAKDMANFYQMLLNGGELNSHRILTEQSVEKMTRIHAWNFSKIGFVPGSAWGLGCGVVQNPIGVTSMLSPGTFGHGGARGTQSWGDPIRNMVFILMIQRTKFGNGDASDIRRAFQEKAVQAYGM